MKPINSHTISNQKGEPSDRAMPAGVRKIPIAMTSPTTRAVTARRPSWRRRGTRPKLRACLVPSKGDEKRRRLRRSGRSANHLPHARCRARTEDPYDEIERVNNRGEYQNAHRQGD